MNGIAFSLCICTRNRPEDLRAAVLSAACSDYPPHQLIVSDDSTGPETRAMLAELFPWVEYIEGPRRGLSSNRNRALTRVTGTHVVFIDDDVILAPDFLSLMAERIGREAQDADRLILTGPELNRGTRVVAHKPTFLGHQALEYGPRDRMCSIVINSTVFPAGLFASLTFDESLVYGYEELDFATRAVRLRHYRIAYLPDAMNRHFPSPINRDFYSPFIEASRIYVTFKRYYWLERRPLKAFLFIAVAYTHMGLHSLRENGVPGLKTLAATIRLSAAYILRCFKAPAEFVQA